MCKNNQLYRVIEISDGHIGLISCSGGDKQLRVCTDRGLHIDQGIAVTSHASQGKTVDQVIVSVPVSAFGQANEAQFYVSMSRARETMLLFTDSKVALREAVTKPGSRLSPVEMMNSEHMGLLQSSRRYSRSSSKGQLRGQSVNQCQEHAMER